MILPPNSVLLGSDPELFLKKKGKVVESEQVVKDSTDKRVVRDGIQVELNPRADTCREVSRNFLRDCLSRLSLLCGRDYKVSLDTTVTIDREEFDKMDAKNKAFGCKPSYNVITGEVSPVKVDAFLYNKRSAGGHIHLGRTSPASFSTLRKVEEIVPVLDYILGNTCVLIDRDSGNVERRKHYGRAGEYRTPDHGLEYRTLSNFWMRSPQLMSLVLGLARLAYVIVHEGYTDKVLSLVPYGDVEQAINNNDKTLARKNWEKIKVVFSEFEMSPKGRSPITGDTVDLFEKFVEYGLDYWFTKDVFSNWGVKPGGSYKVYDDRGFNTFLVSTVKDAKPDGVFKTLIKSIVS